jgi:hypothetical protein
VLVVVPETTPPSFGSSISQFCTVTMRRSSPGTHPELFRPDVHSPIWLAPLNRNDPAVWARSSFQDGKDGKRWREKLFLKTSQREFLFLKQWTFRLTFYNINQRSTPNKKHRREFLPDSYITFPVIR